MPSGYKTVTPVQLSNILCALEKGIVTSQCLRVYFVCLAVVAVREAARRYQKKQGAKPKELARYRASELQRLTELPANAVRRALVQLKRAGLIVPSETTITFNTEPITGSEELLKTLSCGRSSRRPIPFPRSMLRFLAQNRSVTLAKTVIGYAVRGLSLSRRGGDISRKGTVKISWIAEAFGLSERAARSARRRLIEMDWITRDSGSTQRKLNRDGAYFSINLDWTFVKPNKTGGRKKKNFAPPTPQKCTDFAPPYKDMKTSNEAKNQKTQVSEPSGAGFEEGRGQKPLLRNIESRDLFSFGRLESLYEQAAKAKWIEPCEAAALNFVAAAVRAREVGRDPVRLFVGIIRKKLWPHITQAQEDRARQALVRFREENQGRFRLGTPPLNSQPAGCVCRFKSVEVTRHVITNLQERKVFLPVNVSMNANRVL